jgi:hypothetical protein
MQRSTVGQLSPCQISIQFVKAWAFDWFKRTVHIPTGKTSIPSPPSTSFSQYWAHSAEGSKGALCDRKGHCYQTMAQECISCICTGGGPRQSNQPSLWRPNLGLLFPIHNPKMFIVLPLFKCNMCSCKINKWINGCSQTIKELAVWNWNWLKTSRFYTHTQINDISGDR